MELASASTSTAVPAVRHRGPVAALIAAVIVAAALLFAMPSLAYASSEAGGSQQAEQSQEILLSKQDSSKSVSKTPDEPKTPPAYTQQDAYKSTPQSTGSGVDSVTGAGDSATNSYTPGDDKSSINDKDSDSDSDVASDPSISGTKDTDNSTPNEGDDTSDSNKGNDSTADSNGASSGSTDEIATDTNQSAHPTGSDSKADDVIATPGDKGSADLNAGTTSDKTEEVKSEVLGVASGNDSSITTSAVCGITIHWNQTFSGTPSANNPDVQVGHADDPIWATNSTTPTSGTFYTFAGTDTVLANATEGKSAGIDYVCRVGYSFLEWYFIGWNSKANSGAGKWQKLTANTFTKLNSFALYTNGSITEIHAYAKWSLNDASLQFYSLSDTSATGIGANPLGGATNYQMQQEVTFPTHPTISKQTEWYVFKSNDTTSHSANPVTTGATFGDLYDSVYHFRGSTNAWASVAGWATKPLDLAVRALEKKETISFTVTFNNGGGTGAAQTFTYTTSSAVATADGTATGTKPEASFSRTGYDFKGWSTTNHRSHHLCWFHCHGSWNSYEWWHLHALCGMGPQDLHDYLFGRLGRNGCYGSFSWLSNSWQQLHRFFHHANPNGL